MLVLTRKLGESIVIDDDIVLKVTAVHGNRVKVAVEAPKSRRIMRGEIADSVSHSPAPPQEESQWSKTGSDTRTSIAAPPPSSAK
ncbi:MAG: carbon storage regulator [Planctomycetaceae bacterium]|nr:carbon storage regulator [Planctomycetaceae bacterium]